LRDNAGENKEQEIIDFFESVRVNNYFSTAHKQWQDSLKQQLIRSWWPQGQSWRNLDWTWRSILVQSALIYQNRDKPMQGPGHALHQNAQNRETASISPYVCHQGTVLMRFLSVTLRASPAQLRQSISDSTQHTRILLLYFLDEQFKDNSTDILNKSQLDVKWVPYNWLHIANYTRIHYD
jgi:hypothetical protein